MRPRAIAALAAVMLVGLGAVVPFAPSYAGDLVQNPTAAITAPGTAPSNHEAPAPKVTTAEAARTQRAVKARLLRCRAHPEVCVQSPKRNQANDEKVPRSQRP